MFLILLLALPVLSFRILGTQFVVALRKQKFIFFTQILKIVLGILGPVTLLYYFGIWGMAIERILVVIIIGAIYFGYLVRNDVDVRDWKELFYFTKEDVKFVRNMWNIFI